MLKTLLAGAALGFAAPAWSVQPAAPAACGQPPHTAPDPEAVEEGRAMLVEMGFEEQFETTMALTGESTFSTALRELESQRGEAVPAELEQRLRRVMREGLAAVAADMRPTALDDSARIYACYFTARELRELRTLQAHPVMRKMTRVAPEFMNELMQIGVAASARRMPELMERIRQEVLAWEQEARRTRLRTS